MPLDSDNFPKIEKRGKNREKEENREGSFTLSHLTDRAGYATALCPLGDNQVIHIHIQHFLISL